MSSAIPVSLPVTNLCNNVTNLHNAHLIFIGCSHTGTRPQTLQSFVHVEKMLFKRCCTSKAWGLALEVKWKKKLDHHYCLYHCASRAKSQIW